VSILTVEDMMSRDPVSVPPSCPLREAAHLMRTMRIRSLLVKEGNAYVGIVTGTDMAQRVLAEEPYEGVSVGDIMSAPMLTIRTDEPLHRANAQMIQHHIRHLVVVDASERPVGILSARDLLVPEEDVPGAIPFFPHHLLKEVVAALLVLAVLVVLVVISPAPMLKEADPFSTPAHIKPEWYFLAAYQFLKFAEYFRPLGEWAPKGLGIGIMGLVSVALILFPFIDRNPHRAPRKRPLALTFGVVVTLAFIGFTLWGHFS
jgi:CBS domain-containing protein